MIATLPNLTKASFKENIFLALRLGGFEVHSPFLCAMELVSEKVVAFGLKGRGILGTHRLAGWAVRQGVPYAEASGGSARSSNDSVLLGMIVKEGRSLYSLI